MGKLIIDFMVYMFFLFIWFSILNVYIKRVCIYIKEGESDKFYVMDGIYILYLSYKIWCKILVKFYLNK